MCFMCVGIFFTFASKITEMRVLVVSRIKYKDFLQMLEFKHNRFAVIDIDLIETGAPPHNVLQNESCQKEMTSCTAPSQKLKCH